MWMIHFWVYGRCHVKRSLMPWVATPILLLVWHRLRLLGTFFRSATPILILLFSGAYFLQELVTRLNNCLLLGHPYGTDKQIENILVILSHLYNFKVCRYDYFSEVSTCKSSVKHGWIESGARPHNKVSYKVQSLWGKYLLLINIINFIDNLVSVKIIDERSLLSI